jgi:Flp pilus assembly protein TadD
MHRRTRSRTLAELAVLGLAAAAAIALSPALVAPALAVSPRKLMQFGVEAAQQGLWREALSRWQRAVKDDSGNARLRNNLAVAYESLGRLEEADREYREALRLAPDSREIKDNHVSFRKLHPGIEGGEDAPAQVPQAAQP